MEYRKTVENADGVEVEFKIKAECHSSEEMKKALSFFAQSSHGFYLDIAEKINAPFINEIKMGTENEVKTDAGSSNLENEKEAELIERVGICWSEDFAKAIQLFQIITKYWDFDRPFRVVIDYDPKQPRTAIKHFCQKEVSQCIH